MLKVCIDCKVNHDSPIEIIAFYEHEFILRLVSIEFFSSLSATTIMQLNDAFTNVL